MSLQSGGQAMRVAAAIELTQEQRKTLTRLAKGRRTEVRVAMRAKIVLAAAARLGESRDCGEAGCHARNRRSMAVPLCREERGGDPQGSATRWTQAHESFEGRRPDHSDDDPRAANECDSLEHAYARGGARRFAVDGSSSLESERVEAAPRYDVQGQQRSSL